MYQGTLPSPSDYKVEEEFETVSTQLLKCTQAIAPAHQACDLAWWGWWIAFHVLGSCVLLPVLLFMVRCSSLDANEDSPTPSCTRPPMKTYKVGSHISLKLKIKQETRLSKVVHNTALDPVHQPSPAPQNTEPLKRPTPPPPTRPAR